MIARFSRPIVPALLFVMVLALFGALQSSLNAAPLVSVGCSTINTNPLVTIGIGQWRDFGHGPLLYYAGDTVNSTGVRSLCTGGCYVWFRVLNPDGSTTTLASGDGTAPGASYVVPATGIYHFYVGGWSVLPSPPMNCVPSATPASEPVASYVAAITDLTIQFTDTSTGSPAPTSWFWDFGDGSTDTAQHPSHTYAASGTYTVCLTASNVVGSSVPACAPMLVDNSPTPNVVVVSSPATPTTLARPDNRLNWHFGDLEAVIYPARDDAGRPALHVYDVNASGQGQILLVITQADLAPYQTDTPRTNTPIVSVGQVSVYALTTPGQFQINIGPNEEGKTYALVFDISTLEVVHQYLMEPGS